jgi:hypothetical protein
MDFLQLDEIEEFGERQARPAIGNDVIDALREIGLSLGEGIDDPIAWQLLGHCLEELGDGTKARRCYARAARQLVRSGRAGSDADGEAAPQPARAPLAPIEPLPFAVFQDVRVTRDH